MAITRVLKFDMAKAQLETAIGLLVSGRDLHSVITLAGAANGILHELVRRAEKEPFSEYARKVHEHNNKGFTAPKDKYITHINNTLKINSHKHMDKDDEEYEDLDVLESAVGAVSVAVANYSELVGEKHSFVKAFLAWHYQNFGSQELIDAYNNAPDKLK